MEKPKHTNRLSKESSPYLLQHAHNPVNWYPWGEEAFEKAQKEDKPILVSIGYSTCHWCHVMERESFENEAVAHYMNDHFVNIKVDREERPDIDQIYMDAIQALTGAGGWPLNCFLTPDLKPFYGGTYFPPSPNYGRASWRQVLMSIANAYHNKKDQVAEQTERLMDYISNSGKQFYSTIDTNIPKEQVFSPVLLTNIFHTLKKDFDVEDGGFGNAPKFPGTMTLDYLLQYHYYFKDDEAIKHVNHSLERMIYGGIYDQLGGGFSRYSTDAEWLAPHFEKMLYDNALLVRLLSDAYAHTNNPLYLETIEETLEWVSREMTSENGGFFTALDADSEGVEGKFYVWEIADVYRLLGDDAPIFNAYYDISPKGNWEGVNIPRRKMSVEKLAMKIGWEEKELSKCLQKWKTRLFLEREKRIRPGLDDKILLDWNALMCIAYCKAAQVTGKEEYFKIAEKNMAFIYANMKDETGFYHSYAKGKPKYKANLLDSAYLIEALIQLYQTGFGICYIHEAITITDMTIAQFYDEQNGQFYFSPSDMDDLPVRQKDVYDNAMPSGNAVMVHNLQQLQVITGKQDYGDMALKLLSSMKETLEKYPLSFSKWATACFSQVFGFKETAIVGKEALEWAREVNTNYIPQKNVMASLKDQPSFPLLKDRQVEKTTFIYLCSNFRCLQPVDNLNEYMELVKENSPTS